MLLARVPTGLARWPSCSRWWASCGANLLDVEHIREGFDLHVRETAVQLVLETRGPAHAEQVSGPCGRPATPSRARCGSRAPPAPARRPRGCLVGLGVPLHAEHEPRSAASIASGNSSSMEWPVTSSPRRRVDA